MYWRAVPGAVHIVVHTEEAPSDEDWKAYVEDAGQYITDIKGLLVYSFKVGPSASQRAYSSAAFKKMGADLSVAIMTGSRVTQGIVTAISWAIGDKIRAFSSRDFAGAVDYIGLDFDEQIKTRVVLRQLARSAGLEVDAFADGSGRFRKKFGDK